ALMALGEHAMKGESHAPPPVDPDPPPRSRPRRNPRPAPPAPDRLRPHLPRARPPPSAPSRLRLADLPVGGLPALPPCPLTRDRPQCLGRYPQQPRRTPPPPQRRPARPAPPALAAPPAGPGGRPHLGPLPRPARARRGGRGVPRSGQGRHYPLPRLRQPG